ncbi:MAG: polyprenyl synthetase family protein [Bacillota bacterium]|nr:polyprenyl synthetase family protein [Bacillota bacterium]
MNDWFTSDRYEEYQKHLIQSVVTDSKLREMMEYSLFAGGKRFRPSLLLHAFDAISAANGKGHHTKVKDTAMHFAVALECIHTYSLIHDDLPCMDDDDLRRGMPTSHIKYGEAEALLAGDALLNLGFELMAKAASESDSAEAARAMYYVGRASGANGMVLGQFYDIQNEGDVTVAQLDRINLYKTSALIRASIVAGVILASGDRLQIAKAEEIGDCVGMIFQLTDDLIDIHSSAEEAGKTVGSDVDAHKLTYPALLGEDEVHRIVGSLVEKVEALADEISLYFIKDIVKKLVGRKK